MRAIGERLRARPLGLLALCAAAGIILANHLPPWSFYWLVIAGSALSLWAWTSGGTRALSLLTAITFAVLHQTSLHETRAHPLFIALEKQNAPCACIVTGRVEKALRRDLPGSKPGASWFHATEVTVPSLQRRFTGHAPLKLVTDKTTSLPPGEYRIEGKLHLASTPDNPGQFDQRDHDVRLGLAAELRALQVTSLKEDRVNIPALMQDTAENGREWIKRQLSLEMEDSSAESTLIQAMILGATEAATDEMEKPFRQTGTIHLFAVSGLHVGIVGFIFLLFLRPFGARRSVMLMILLPSLFAYAFITGLRPATLRAAIMAAVFLSAALFHRRSDSLNSLGAAALLILACDTQQFFSVGFQLSFGVIAAIAMLNPIFRRPFMRFVDADPFIPKPLLSAWQHRWISTKTWLLSLFTVSASATCGSVPLMMSHFHIVTPSSLFANMVLVPMAFFVLFTAVVTLFSAAVHLPGVQALFSNANWLFAKATFFFAQMFSCAPGAYHYVPAPSFAPRAPMEFNILRMPDGEAAQHLRIGDAHWLLDDGGLKDFRFILRPYLQYRGVSQITGLVLSHGDSEHTGGTVPLLHEYEVHTIYQNTLEAQNRESGRSALHQLSKQGIKAHPLAANDVLGFNPHAPTIKACVLYPPRGARRSRADDRALVMRLDLGNYRILWCNDAGFIAEKTILETFSAEALRCDIIVRNQHASDFSMLPEFLDTVQPRLLISSNSTFPPEQKLPSQLREACAARQIHLLDQAQTGAVTLNVWPQRMEVIPFKQPEFVILPQAGR